MVDELESQGFVSLAISAAHAQSAPTLPPHHRDPFDRMLVAQAQLEALVLVTADTNLVGYDVERFEARSWPGIGCPAGDLSRGRSVTEVRAGQSFIDRSVSLNCCGSSCRSDSASLRSLVDRRSGGLVQR